MSKPRKSDRYRVTLTVEGTGCSMYHHGRTRKEAWARLLERVRPAYLTDDAFPEADSAFRRAALLVGGRTVAATSPARWLPYGKGPVWARLHVEVRRLEREA